MELKLRVDYRYRVGSIRTIVICGNLVDGYGDKSLIYLSCLYNRIKCLSMVFLTSKVREYVNTNMDNGLVIVYD